MPVLAALGAIVPAITGLAQGIGGLVAGGKRPQYEIPKEVLDSINLARQRSSQAYSPGYMAASQSNQVALANMISGIQQSGRPLEGISSVGSFQQRSLARLQSENERFQDRSLDTYINAARQLTPASQYEFEANDFGRYAQGRGTAQSGFQNFIDSAPGLLSAISSLSGQKWKKFSKFMEDPNNASMFMNSINW